VPVTVEQAKTELRRRRATEELEWRRQPEQPDFGMIAIPKEELPGAFEYNRQLDEVLGDPEKSIEDLMPLDVRYDIGRIVGMTEKPDETKEKMKNSLYYSVQFGIPPRISYNIIDELMKMTKFNPAKAKPEERGFFGKVAESWRRGDAQVMADISIYETAFEGRGDEEQALAALKKIQEEQALDPIEGNFLAELVYSGVEIVPGMAKGYWEAIPQAFAGMGIGAGMALAAGQVPPLTLAPEEIVGVPAGALVGAKFGLMTGSAMFWYKQGAGSMYAAMREKDYNPELSKHIAGAAAIPYAIVEFLQVSALTPGLRRGALKVAQKSMLKVVANATKKYGTVWGTEVFEEVVQEIIQIGAEDMAGYLSDKLKLPEGISEFLLERGRRVWEMTKAAGKAMALLPIPGAAIDVYTGKRTIVPVEKKPEIEAEKPAVKEVKAPPTVAIPAPEKPVAPITPEKAVEVAPEAKKPLSELVTDVKEAMNEFFETRPMIGREQKTRRKAAEKALKDARKRLGEELPPKGTPAWKMTKRQFEAKAIGDRSVVANLNAIMAGLAEGEGFEHVPYIPEEVATTHKREVEKALAEGKPVPAEVLKDYPDLAKAEPAKVEKPKEPKKPGVSLLGGVPVKAPGLTKAEVEHLGKREQEALRAAQRRGLKVGYKQGVAETITGARRSLDAFRMKEAISQKGKMDVASVVLTYVPKEKQGDYIRRILAAKTQKRVERLTEAIDTYLDKYEKRQAIKGFKGFVKGIKKKYRRGEVALGQLPNKLRESLIEVLDKFDLAKISEKKEETLESRLKFVTRISGELANGFEGLNAEFDKDATDLLLMGTRRIDELKRLSQKYIGDLDVDEIKYIQASLEHLLKINDLKGKSKERRRIENLRNDINNARQEVKPAKERVVEWTGLLGALRWIEVEGQSTMRSLVGLVTGKNYEATMKLLVHEPNKTNIERKGKYKDFIMHFRKLADKANLNWKDVKKFNDRIKIKLGGREIETDYASMLSILAHIEAEGNLRQLLRTKGLNITVYARDEHGFITKKNIYRVGTPSLAELRAIVELIPETHKKLLNVYFKTNWEKQAPAINEMSMKHQNYDLAVKKEYFHISREIERAVEGKKADLSVSIDQQSRGLPRTGGTARINIRPFPLEVIETMQWSAAYATMTEAMENARTLVANPKWREAMKQAGNQRALKEITTLLRRSQGLITDQSILEAMAGTYLRQIGKSILSLRISGGFVQTASMPAAIEFIDKKYLFNADFPTPALIKHLKNIDPVLWLRWEGKQFDYALGMVGAQTAFEKLLFDHTPLTDKFLGQYTMGDEVAIAKLFMAAERQIEGETKLKKGTAEFEKAALDLLHEAMHTQPQWDMLHRTPITSDPSMFIRPFTMFRSAIIAQRNVMVRAIDDYRKGRITKEQMAERIAGVGMSSVLVVLSRHLFKTLVFAGATTALVAMGLREPPDEEEIKEEATKLAKKIGIQSAFTFVGLDIVGSLFASMGYKALQVRKYGWGMGGYGDIRTGNIIADVTLDVMQTGVDFVLFTEQLISGEKYKSGKNRGRYKWEITGLRLIDEIAALFAYRYGLPYEGPKSDIVWPVQKALPEEPVRSIKRRKAE
jgi:hypothetical protein